jgi:hypothetical protein
VGRDGQQPDGFTLFSVANAVQSSEKHREISEMQLNLLRCKDSVANRLRMGIVSVSHWVENSHYGTTRRVFWQAFKIHPSR